MGPRMLTAPSSYNPGALLQSSGFVLIALPQAESTAGACCASAMHVSLVQMLAGAL